MNNIYKKVVFVFFSMASVAHGAAAQEAFPDVKAGMEFSKFTLDHKVKILNTIYSLFTVRRNLIYLYFGYNSTEVIMEHFTNAIFKEVFPYSCENECDAKDFIMHHISSIISIFNRLKQHHYKGNVTLWDATVISEELGYYKYFWNNKDFSKVCFIECAKIAIDFLNDIKAFKTQRPTVLLIDVSTTGHKSDPIIIERPTEIGKDSLFYKEA